MIGIVGYCSIRNKTIRLNSQVIFSRESGSIDSFLEEAVGELQVDYPKYYKMDRLSKLGFLAAEMLVRKHPSVKSYDPQEVGIVLSNAHASLDTDLQYFRSMQTFPSPALFVYTLANIVAGEICIRHGFKGENAFLVSERFMPGEVQEYVSAVMNARENYACLAGWVDVLGEQHDVFLYLVNKRKNERLAEHSAEQIEKLYHADN